jgi:hypothetical protein
LPEFTSSPKGREASSEIDPYFIMVLGVVQGFFAALEGSL